MGAGAGQIFGAIGETVGGIANANALKGQADARREVARQEIESTRLAQRQQIGRQAVQFAGTGLQTQGFSDILSTQSGQDTENLARIMQAAKWDIKLLNRDSNLEEIGTAFNVVGNFIGAEGSGDTIKPSKRGGSSGGQSAFESGRRANGFQGGPLLTRNQNQGRFGAPQGVF